MANLSLEDTIRASMNIIDGDEFHNTFVTIAKIASENLAKTLGPYAHTTLIDDGSSIYSTKDGWNIINRLQFGDGLQNSLFGMIKDISYHLVTTVGDGTTTAIVAANAMIQALSSPEYKDYIATNRQKDLLESMNRVKDEIKKTLESKKYLHTVTSKNNYEDIYKIAMVSSNENEEISNIIREIYCKTNNPNIHVTLGNGRKIDYDIQVGYRLDCKPRNLNAFINYEGNLFKTKNAATLFVNHNITYAEHREIILALLNAVSGTGETLFIFAPYFDDIITGAIMNDIQQYLRAGQTPPIFPIQVPMSRLVQQQMFEDAALITKSQIFDSSALKEIIDFVHPHDEEGKPIQMSKMDHDKMIFELSEKLKKYFGYNTNATVSDEYVLFEDYDRENTYFKNTLNTIKKAYEEAREKAAKDMSPLNKEFMDISTRYVRLSGAMGIINIGAESELEQRCVKDSVDDAVLACKSAFTYGYVNGMNIATISAATDVCSNVELSDMDRKIALIVSDVFREVTMEMMRNKYPTESMDARVWTSENSKLSSNEIIAKCVINNCAYDVVKEEYLVDDVKIINSVKTDIEIIGAMMSIVSYALTSNQMLSLNRKYDKEIAKRMVNEAEYEKYSNIAKAIFDVFKVAL